MVDAYPDDSFNSIMTSWHENAFSITGPFEGIPPVPMAPPPPKAPVTRSFGVFFDAKLLNKQASFDHLRCHDAHVMAL